MTPPPTEIAQALTTVASGEHDSVVFRSSLDGRLWVLVSRIEGEDPLLGEAVSDEYVGRHAHLAEGTLSRLEQLGWGGPSGDYTRWVPAGTEEERAALATLVWRTLVEAYGHDEQRVPAIDFP